MKVSLLTWNVWYKEKAENIIELLKQENPDIICLQELTQNDPHSTQKDVPEYISKELGYNYYHIVANTWNNETLGNGIFSRFPLVDEKHVYVAERNDNSDDFSKEGRVYVEAKVDLGEQSVTVGTTHLSYTHKFIETEQKLREVDNLINQFKKERYIVCGDFNVPPESKTMQHISEELQHVSPPFEQNTWTTKLFSYNGFEETELNWRLDYIFASQDLKIIGSSIVETEYSDHLPVKLEFEV